MEAAIDQQRVLLRKYLEDLDLVAHNIDSFDQAVGDLIHYLEGKEWTQNSRIENPETHTPEATYKLRFTNFRLEKPTVHNDINASDEPISPTECVERHMTYQGKFMATVHVWIEGGLPRFRDSLEPMDVTLMSIPIPIGSRYCNSTNALDPEIFPYRAAFIVNGQRKNAFCFETASTNLPVFMYDKSDGYTYEVRSHSAPVLKHDLIATVYSNVVSVKRGVVVFSTRSFRLYNKGVGAVTLVNVLSNLGLHTQEDIAAALLGPEPTDDLREALALSLTNVDDFPLPPTPEAIRANFGAPPLSIASHLGRRSTGTNEPPFFRTDRHTAWAESVLEREILPHCGTNNEAKIWMLCSMARRVALATYLKPKGIDTPVDNRDDLCNKFIKGYGDLLTGLVLDSMKVLRERIKMDIRKLEKNQRPPAALTRTTFPAIPTLTWFSSDVVKTIGNGQLRSPVTRGKPGFGGSFAKAPARKTVTQSYGQTNYSGDLSSLRNFKKTINKQSKVVSARNIQSSQFLYKCPTETREGQEVGLDDALTLGATTTLHGSVDSVVTVITQFDRTRPMERHVNPDDFIVCINGMPYALVTYDDASDLVEYLRNARRSGLIEPFTSVTVGAAFEAGVDIQEIHIRCNPGRLTAALLIVDDSGRPVLERRQKLLEHIKSTARPRTPDEMEAVRALEEYSFSDLMRPLFIHFGGTTHELPAAAEYIDVFERKNVYIAESLDDIRPSHTHVMIHPSLILGSSAAEVPFSDHNQSPRNAYQCGMGKQAIAGRRLRRIVSPNMPAELLYSQTPLVSTEFSKVIMEKHPCPTGVNAVVAIMSYLDNQEDAVVVNEAAIQRGMFVSEHFEVFSSTARSNGYSHAAEMFAFPDPATVCQGFPTGGNSCSFEHIDENGCVVKGTILEDGDPLICKLRRFQSATHECFMSKRGIKCRCTFANEVVYFHGNDTAIVDEVQRTTNAQGDALVNVVVRYFRAPRAGDKLASRHGQKGTIGRVVPQVDLPFNQDGICPDIIVNPHAIPSRMTVAHLLETFAGMVTCVTGEEIDATPFGRDSQSKWTARNLAKALKDAGMSEFCEDFYTCGMTGQPIEGTIFTGPIFYQRLKQMPIDKAHARPTGKVMSGTRQPVGGRASNGGKRLGGMERDCLASHGASGVVRERFMVSSDFYNVHVCNVCDRPCIGNDDRREYRCDVCGNVDPDNMSVVEMPYAGKLLLQEITALNISVEVVTEHSMSSSSAGAGK